MSTRPQLAERFGVSVSCVRDLIRRVRQTGQAAAKAHGGGAQRKADARQEQLLTGLVAARNDHTLEEYRLALPRPQPARQPCLCQCSAQLGR